MKHKCNYECKGDGSVKSIFIIDSDSKETMFSIDSDKSPDYKKGLILQIENAETQPRSQSVIFSSSESIDAYNKLMRSAIRREVIDMDNGNIIHTF